MIIFGGYIGHGKYSGQYSNAILGCYLDTLKILNNFSKSKK